MVSKDHLEQFLKKRKREDEKMKSRKSERDAAKTKGMYGRE